MENKVVLVTGATSGIGAAIATHLASIGYKKLVLVGRRKEKLDEVAQKCKDLGANDVLVIIKDLAVTESAKEIVDLSISHFGRLDVLISNAGSLESVALIRDQSEKVYDRTFQINLKSPFFLCKHAIPHLERTRGNILIISSVSDEQTLPRSSVYGPSKAAVTMLGKCLALELGSSGVRANVIAPGIVVTDFLRDMGSQMYENSSVINANSLLGRFGNSDEMAKMAAFIVSEDAGFMTGSRVVIDGGRAVMTRGPIQTRDATPPSAEDLPKDKESQVVLVVGATSGIGAATSIHLAREGYRNLALVGRRKEQLENVAQQCRDLGATNVLVLIKDLAKNASAAEIIEETTNHFERLDVVIANAGTTGQIAPIKDQTEANFDFVMQVNMRSNFFLCQKAIPHLERTQGNIVIVSSVADVMPSPGASVYCLSKAAVSMFGRLLATEMADRGINVNLLCPGVISTELFRDMPTDMFTNSEAGKNFSAIGRVGKAEEMAATVAFLISSANAFMTGSTIVSDGGAQLMTRAALPGK